MHVFFSSKQVAIILVKARTILIVACVLLFQIRIENTDNSTLIANFKEGFVHGSYRRWDGNKKLREMGYGYNGQR